MKPVLAFACFIALAAVLPAADEPTPEQLQFQKFVRHYAAKIHATERAPASKEDWLKRKAEIRRGLEDAWDFPDEKCPLEPKKLGEEQRDGYRFEKLIFQTMPGVWMTAFAYVPDVPGKVPAILMVHGHWKGAKQDPVPQARCIGAAKHGFFVLAVDAFGAGERGITKNLGEYHGEMVGATLFPLGRPLSGIQVYENMRAVEYLQSRPEVNPEKIGITGASGGGNQSMYAGCYDERIGCVIPCCSVGTYDAYLTTGCCMCEVVPTALKLTEEWGVLGLAAPRGLMVINASNDGFQFSIGEARKSLRRAADVFDALEQPNYLRHNTFFWRHDYSKSMREAMYGWMTYHLKGEGDGAPIAEAKVDTFDPEKIRCFPNGSRPDDWLTLPQFAAREGKKLLADGKPPASKEDWETKSAEMRKTLVEKTFGGFPERTPLNLEQIPTDDKQVTLLKFEPEPGLQLTARWEHPVDNSRQTAILLNLDGGQASLDGELAKELRNGKVNFVTLDLRATGKLAHPRDGYARAPDHNLAQWSMWIGRPLLGQWTYDVLRLLDALDEAGAVGESEIVLACRGPAGVIGLCAAAVDPQHRIAEVGTVGLLSSYVTDVPYEGQRVGIMAPGILRDVGDIPQLAALAFPARVNLVAGVTPGNKPLSQDELETAFAATRAIAKLIGQSPQLQLNAGK